MIKEMTGDIFYMLDTGVVQAIAHGCNARGAMGAGVAAVVSQRWPAMYQAYKETCALGMFNPGMHWNCGDGKWVFNLFTQVNPGPCADLELIRKAVTGMDLHAQILGLTKIAMPWIGAGIGGLKWPDVKAAIEPILGPSPVEYSPVEYCQFSGNKP